MHNIIPHAAMFDLVRFYNNLYHIRRQKHNKVNERTKSVRFVCQPTRFSSRGVASLEEITLTQVAPQSWKHCCVVSRHEDLIVPVNDDKLILFYRSMILLHMTTYRKAAELISPVTINYCFGNQCGLRG